MTVFYPRALDWAWTDWNKDIQTAILKNVIPKIKWC